MVPLPSSHADATVETDRDQSKASRASTFLSGRTALFLTIIFGVSGSLLAIAERLAATGDHTWNFVVFWVADLLIFLPLAWLMLRSHSTNGVPVALVIALGAWGMLPKLVRTGFSPTYADEFIHFRVLTEILRVGHPVSDFGLLQIGASFPGLEILTAGLVHVTGMTATNASVVVIFLAHVAAIAGVYTLLRDISRSARVGGVGALIYALNPSWLFFDTQYSYESLALALMVWIWVFTRRAVTSDRGSTLWARLDAWIALLLIFALAMTHHVTSIVNALILLLFALVITLRQRHGRADVGPESATVAWVLGLVAAAVTIWRIMEVGEKIYSYLSPIIKVNLFIEQFLSLVGLAASHANRTAFGGAGIPPYEIIAGYAMIPILLILFAWGVLGLARKLRTLESLVIVMALLGVAYFASIGLLTDQQFSESVHRSWSFSFIGLATVISFAVHEHLEGRLAINWGKRTLWPVPSVRPKLLAAVAVAALVIVDVGGVATGTTTEYRFGAPVSSGADAVFIGTQSAMVASWFHEHTTSHDVLFADRYLSRAITVVSPIQYPLSSNVWSLTFASAITVNELHAVYQEGITYIVVDRRMGNGHPPKEGFWYTYDEPHAFQSYSVPAQNVERYGCFNWLNAVYATTEYQVFHVNRPLLIATLFKGSTGISAACAQRGIT